ncbi:MAG: hypothetical protein Kow0042_31590 [Calditrichia bacterium]
MFECLQLRINDLNSEAMLLAVNDSFIGKEKKGKSGSLIQRIPWTFPGSQQPKSAPPPAIRF